MLVEIVSRNRNTLSKPTVSKSDNQVLLKVKMFNKVEVLTLCFTTIAYFNLDCDGEMIPCDSVKLNPKLGT